MIKIKTFLLILFIVAFYSCSDNRYPESLIVADSIADKNPDMAVAMLNSMRPQIMTAGDAVKNYYALLQIKAADKAYITHTSDTVILRLVDYYENGGDKALLPMVYYYAGRVYRDLQDAPQALDFFRKAEDVIKNCGSENTKLLAYIYGQTGTILDYQGFYKEALKEFVKENSVYSAIEDTVGLIYNFRDIGGVYWAREKLDSTLYYYKKALDLAVKIKDTGTFANINEQIAALYINLGNTDATVKCLHHAAPYLDPRDISSTLSIYSDLYEKTGKTDSAFICYKKLLDVGNIYGKQGAYKGLAEYYLDKGNNKEVKKYLNLYMQITDSIKKINMTEAVANSLTMYNYSLRERDNYELKINLQKEKGQKNIILFIFVLLVFILSSGILWYRHKDNLNKLEKEKAELAEKNRILEEQRIMEDKKLQIKGSDIYRLIKKKISDYLQNHEALTDDEWKELNSTVNGIYENFELKVHDYVPGISTQEYRICLLLKINIRPTYIAYMTNHSKEAINSTRRRLYEKAFGIKGGPSEWDKLILSL